MEAALLGIRRGLVMRYQLDWFDHFGNKKGVIQAFSGLEYVKTLNAIGSLVVDIPRGLYQYDQFAVGDILEIWRAKNDTLELQNEAAYFLQNWQFTTDPGGEEFIRLTAFDANWLLDTAIVYAAAGSADASMTGYPDNLMKAIVNKQLGATATAGRGKLTVAPDLSAGGASVTKAFAYRNVLNVLAELAAQAGEGGTFLAFDTVRTQVATFEFRTYTGQRGINHSRTSGDPRLAGKQYGNLSEPTFGTFHAAERNYIYVGGQGEEAARVIVERSNATRINASKWNRREMFMDARQQELTASLNAEGDAALDEFKPKKVLTGRLRDTPGMQYGVHYGFGDILSAEAFGFHVDCHVASVRVNFNQDNGEQIDIRLRGEM